MNVFKTTLDVIAVLLMLFFVVITIGVPHHVEKIHESQKRTEEKLLLIEKQINSILDEKKNTTVLKKADKITPVIKVHRMYRDEERTKYYATPK